MVEHFHHRERIADFVRHLRREQAQGGKFFVLTQLLLHIHHPLVKPGFFDGNGRQFRQARTTLKPCSQDHQTLTWLLD